MNFRIAVTSGGEVIFAGSSRKDAPVYYGAPPESGLWRINIARFEKYFASELEGVSFGDSIETYIFGFEIAELEEWGRWFKETRDYISYRPKSKTLVSVGQVEWKQVKDENHREQFTRLAEALMTSISRIATLKRKPKHFSYVEFSAHIAEALSKCNPATFVTNDA